MGMDDRELELLSAYLDGALNESERQALETRLAQDALLQRELDLLRETKQLVASLPTLKAPRNLTIARSARQPYRQPLVLSPWISSLSAVAAAFMLIAGFVLLNRTPAMPNSEGALAQTAISMETTPEAALRAAPAIASARPSQTAAVLLNEESSSTESAQAQEPEASADQALENDEQAAAGAGIMATLPPMPSPELPYDAVAPAAPLAEGGSGEADQGQEREFAPGADDGTAPDASAALGAAAEIASTATSPAAGQQSDAFIAPTPTAMATQQPTAVASATPSPTLTPTAVPTIAPIPAPIATSGTSADAGGIALLIVGVLLLVVAVITTVLRRQRIA